MARTAMYPVRYVTLQNTPYLPVANVTRPECGGVLRRGEQVWTEPLDGKRPETVQAYVEQVGVVKLDPLWLVPANALQEGGGHVDSGEV